MMLQRKSKVLQEMDEEKEEKAGTTAGEVSEDQLQDGAGEVSDAASAAADSGAAGTDESDSAENAAASENAAADGSENELELLAKKVDALEKERDDFKDQYLRKSADFDNYRKRMIKEKQDAFDYANTSLLKDLLDSLDNFDRTVEAASSSTDAKSIADGVTMINKGLVSMLENKYNLVAYGKAGDAFDPELHEAIGKSDDPVPEPVVKAVYLKGYKLKDRVIRLAKVMVSMPDGTVAAGDKGTASDTEAPAADENAAAE